MVSLIISIIIFSRDHQSFVSSDYNFVRHGNQCVPVGPEPIPAGVCKDKHDKYMGSSGFRLIPGNTCIRESGKKKDEKIEKSCENGMCYRIQMLVR
jgi:hypothetical protein